MPRAQMYLIAGIFFVVLGLLGVVVIATSEEWVTGSGMALALGVLLILRWRSERDR